jgi:hypothetical protein
MKQFDPYGGAEWGKGLVIDFDNLSWSNTMLSINIITPNVTVRSLGLTSKMGSASRFFVTLPRVRVRVRIRVRVRVIFFN